MQRSTYRIETRLINDFPLSVSDEKVFKGSDKTEEVKNVKELRKFFNGLKRAMKFGSSKGVRVVDDQSFHCQLCIHP